MNIRVLGSGSRGNAACVEHNGTVILIDIGFSLSKIAALLKEAGFLIHNLKGVVITHEHADHIAGLRQFMKKCSVPVYMNEGTRDALKPYIDSGTVREFRHGEAISIGTIAVIPFAVMHDAADPSGFRFEAGGRKAAFVTDIGYVTTFVKEQLKGCNALFLESNHDEGRLLQGPYSWYLKQRIMSRRGHLSNGHSARTIEEVYSPELRDVVLMHLSEENNTPELAENAHSPFIRESGIRLSLSKQHDIGDMIQV